MFLTEGMKKLEEMREENSKKCFSEFGDICGVIEESIDTMRRLTVTISSVGREALDNIQFQTNDVLFARTIETSLSSYDHALKGEYGTSKALVRVIIDCALLMKHFSNKPSDASEWLENKKEFHENDIRKMVLDQKLRKDYEKFYDKLCDYIHPNLMGCGEYFRAIPEGDHTRLLVRNASVYDSEYAKDSLLILVFAVYVTLESVLLTFKDYIEREPEMIQKLFDLEKEILKLLPKDPK